MLNQSDIPNTFCPAKWDELIVNYQHNYVYSCCKATPIVFVNNYKDIIRDQKLNLLNGVQDKSCNYCWKVENNNKPSRRQSYLQKFDYREFDLYRNIDKSVKSLEINLGNTCNMQCIYCNPKFSSQWEDDIRHKKYPVFTDRYVYEISDKKDIRSIMISNYEIIKKENPSSIVILGGEPLLNKYFWEIADSLTDISLSLSTNFNCDRAVVQRLIDLEKKNNINLELCVSIDCTATLATFNRLGIDYNQFVENVRYFATHCRANTIIISSLMTAITILDIENFIIFLESLQALFPDKTFINSFHACVVPKIQSFNSIPDHTRQALLHKIKNFGAKIKLQGIDNIISYLESSKFDIGLHKQLTQFINEWESRKQITLDKQYREQLCL